MKKLIKSKKFILGALATLCIAVLMVCALWGVGNQSEFVPDDPTPLPVTDNWTEAAPRTEANSSSVNAFSRPQVGQAATREQEFPQVVNEKADEVVIDFTDPNPPRENPPEKPATEPGLYNDPDNPPGPTSDSRSTTQENATPTQQLSSSGDGGIPQGNGNATHEIGSGETQQGNAAQENNSANTSQGNRSNNPGAPQPENRNSNGEVFDPVFGWVRPGNSEQRPIDSDGDPNKMVGSMN